jgi:AcrR family transcriptional regulator
MTRRANARAQDGESAVRAPRTADATAGHRRGPHRSTELPRPAAQSAALGTILHAAGELLDESGRDGLNTTAIARRAGVSTATLYRLFPDKHAVLRALVLEVHNERAAAVSALYRAVGDAPDWRVPLAEAQRVAYRLRLARPGGRSTRRALQGSPELWQWDQAQTEDIARTLARAIRKRRPEVRRVTAERVALVGLTASVALLDLACTDAKHGAALVEEGIRLREAYLAPYLDRACASGA